MRRRPLTLIAAGSSAALIASLGLAVAPAASGVDSQNVLVGTAAYQYGNWSQPGAGFKAPTDDTLSQVYQLTWRSAFPDLDDTPGPIYAAGTFIESGSTTINRVGMWDDTTSTWVPLPGDDTGIGFGVGQTLAQTNTGTAGFTLPGVFGLALGGDDSLYAGGAFVASDDTLNNVAKWNGSDWVRMGNGLTAGASGFSTVNQIVQDMVMGNDFIGMDDTNYSDDTVYAIGGFAGICSNLACSSSTAAASIAQYSQANDTWYRMGNGTISQTSGLDDLIFAGAYIDDTLYVGGNFTSLGGVQAKRIARWNESTGTWLSLGGGLANGVFSMAVHPITKDLYVGGTFTSTADDTGTPLIGVAKWDYTDDTWYTVGTGLANPNVDDISFSADGKTMWIGNWDNAPTVGGTTGNGVATLTSEDFDDTAATTINGAWEYLKSAGVIGVTGPASSQINQKSVRAALAMADGSVMFGGNFATAGPLSAGRVAIFTVGPEPSPYDPVYPAGVPTNVIATPGWNTVRIDWTPPTYTGSYPITNYLVQASPGGAVCITRLTDPKLNQCTYTSLTPGTQYTFKVQALNGAGWGERSAASNVASPYNLKITQYKRVKNKFLFIVGGSTVTVSGAAPGYANGTRVTPWVRWGNRGTWEEQRDSRLTVRQGRFSSVMYRKPPLRRTFNRRSPRVAGPFTRSPSISNRDWCAGHNQPPREGVTVAPMWGQVRSTAPYLFFDRRTTATCRPLSAPTGADDPTLFNISR